MRKQGCIILACEQLEQSYFDTRDEFTVSTIGDLNEEILALIRFNCLDSSKAGLSFEDD